MNDITKSNLEKLEASFEENYSKSTIHRKKAAIALCGIFQQKLYKEDYGDFGAYLKERWGVAKATGYALMGEFDPAIGQYKETRQNRSTLNESGNSDPKKPIIDAEFEAQDAPGEEYKDQEGHIVPPDLLDFFKESDDFLRPISYLVNQLQAEIDKVMNVNTKCVPKDPRWFNFNYSIVKNIHIFNIKKAIKFARPWSICVMCGGDGGVNGGCGSCDGKGWCIHKEYETISREDKENWK